jgi:hypothetical protein
MDGLDGFDGGFGLGDVFFQRQRGAIENDHVEAGASGLFSTGEGVSMVGVEKNGVRELVAIGVYERGGLAYAEKIALTFRDADDNGDIELASGGNDGFECGELGEIEMAKRDAIALGLLK